ncbi:transposase [Streptomyces sp. NBC_00083]|uniref:IS701 family transposase n=1 Tax=Streptomyces sp. NBC_00083 TaxID=2975647 RepID=UPI00224E32A2|nr:transposase [Streptomyces sp. NBC_00083]MCX5387491.1 transposase [Streptomyces sp. NBC_00083]
MGQHVRHVDAARERQPEAPFEEIMCDPELFVSLRRAGQRLKAQQYVRGLLALPGRKTLRNIATQFGGDAAEQSVHHFISASPWEWMPLRGALARQVRRTLSPEAWVVRPVVIPKVGAHSIGVDQQFLPSLGRSLNGQYALGTWLASPRSAVPVDWRLRLAGRWLEEPLRQRVGIPAGLSAGTLEGLVRASVARLTDVLGSDAAPVVVDVAGIDSVALAGDLSAMGVPFLARVSSDTPLRLDRGRLPRYGDRGRTAGELAASLAGLRRQVNPGDGTVTGVAVPVAVPHPGARTGELLLVGEWRAGASSATGAALWLTNLEGPSLAELLRLTRLRSVVARDFATVSERVGAMDFAGRSYPGWHRHITLASIAHYFLVRQPDVVVDQVKQRSSAQGDVDHRNRPTVR